MSDTDIPGDPAGLAAFASQLRRAAADVESVANGLAGRRLDGVWVGAAGSAFRASIGQLPGELAKVTAAFGDGAGAVSAFASHLTEFQHAARWYAAQIASSEGERRMAEQRHAQAQTKLAEAHLAHSLATDPVSLQTAKAAVDVGAGLLRQAWVAVEDSNATIARLRAGAAHNHSDYERAVSACASALDGASHAGAGSFHSWAGDHARQLLGGVEAGLGALWLTGERLLKDGEHEAQDLLKSAERALGLSPATKQPARRPGAKAPAGTGPGQPPVAAGTPPSGTRFAAALQAKGVQLSAEQIANLTTALTIAGSLGASPVATQALICAGIGESNWRSVANAGGSPYWGVLQGSKDVFAEGDVTGEVTSFLVGGKGYQAGGAIALGRTVSDPGTIAYRVEGDISNFPDAAAAANFYGKHLTEAQSIIQAWADAAK